MHSDPTPFEARRQQAFDFFARTEVEQGQHSYCEWGEHSSYPCQACIIGMLYLALRLPAEAYRRSSLLPNKGNVAKIVEVEYGLNTRQQDHLIDLNDDEGWPLQKILNYLERTNWLADNPNPEFVTEEDL